MTEQTATVADDDLGVQAATTTQQRQPSINNPSELPQGLDDTSTVQHRASRDRKVATLHLRGIDEASIAEQLKIIPKTVNRIIIRLEKEKADVNPAILRGLLLESFTELIHTDDTLLTELVTQFVDAQVERDTKKGKTVQVRVGKHTIEVDTTERLNDRLRDMAKDIQTHHKEHWDLVMRMGVPRIAQGGEKGSHTADSPRDEKAGLLEIPDLYGQDKDKLLIELEKSAKRQIKFVKDKQKEEK